jgi:hypothetical protein
MCALPVSAPSSLWWHRAIGPLPRSADNLQQVFSTWSKIPLISLHGRELQEAATYRAIFPLFVLAAAFAQSGYYQIKKITIGGEGGWSISSPNVSHTNEIDMDMKTHNIYLAAAELQHHPPAKALARRADAGPAPGSFLELPPFSNSDVK